MRKRTACPECKRLARTLRLTRIVSCTVIFTIMVLLTANVRGKNRAIDDARDFERFRQAVHLLSLQAKVTDQLYRMTKLSIEFEYIWKRYQLIWQLELASDEEKKRFRKTWYDREKKYKENSKCLK